GWTGSYTNLFQSAPGWDAGRNALPRQLGSFVTFQSAPGWDAGRNESCTVQVGFQQRFNPLPAGMPGEIITSSSSAWTALFQSAPGWDAGRNARNRRLLPASQFQSAPGWDAGRNVESRSRKEKVHCFNPLPAGMPGEMHDREAAK